MKASVIIPSRNTRSLLLDCVASVRAAEPDVEIIVVDNNSGDGSVDAVRNAYPGVKLVENDTNNGFAAACNAGAALATGSAFFFLNSDTVIRQNTIRLLLAALANDPALGAVGPRNVGREGEEQDSVEPLPSPKNELSGRQRRQERAVAKALVSEGQSIAGQAYLCGAALMVRREAFEQVGGFDERFFFYYEDADLCARLAEAGWDICQVRECEIIHYGGGSSREVGVGAIIEMHRSRHYYIRKHYGDLQAERVRVKNMLTRLRRTVIGLPIIVATLGLAPRIRKRFLTNYSVLVWMIRGMPERDSSVYRRSFGNWS